MTRSSHSPPSSSIPPSSPFAGTDPTLYTPDISRKAVRTTTTLSANPAAESSRAAGKRPAAPITEVFRIGGIDYAGFNPQPHKLGTFVNELDADKDHFVSRHVFIQAIPDGAHIIDAGTDHEAELVKVQDRMKHYAVFNTCVPIYNRGVYLRFDDLHDACEAKQVLEGHNFVCSFVDNYQFALAKSQDTAAIDEFEGQLRIEIHATPTVTEFQAVIEPKDLDSMHKDLEAALSYFGPVRGVVHTATHLHSMRFTFRIEYFSVEAANRARGSLLLNPMSRVDQNGLWTWNVVHAANWTGPRPSNSPHRRMPRVDDRGRFMDFRHLPTVNLPAPPLNHPHDSNNRVIREKILQGKDVRTTIMLRNIPNKLDWLTLKSLLDHVCFGTYDFVYLRIDFKSGHNVGYAFINFCDISGMIAMLDHVEGRGWPGYRSSKNAELSYATIQGREALVQKFRNSSVMQQTPYCRPRLFMTYEEAINHGVRRKTGIEIKFPDPDNWSKFQRSIDSAHTVGLFPPTGMTHQTIDRAHMSAYDRGTPRDMVHMYEQFGHPPMFNGFSDANKRKAEQLFADKYGPAQSGYVCFDHIPVRLAHQLLGDSPANPGVIARPAPAQAFAASSAGPSFSQPSAAQPFAGTYTNNGDQYDLSFY